MVNLAGFSFVSFVFLLGRLDWVVRAEWLAVLGAWGTVGGQRTEGAMIGREDSSEVGMLA